MQVGLKEASPPYVSFVTESYPAGLVDGLPTHQDVDIAYITPAGSKDRIPKVVKDWFEMLEQQASMDPPRFPRAWLREYKEAYQAWKEGRELPVSGTPIISWPVASPAQVKTLLDMKIRSVEQLAEANEEALGRLGMGGRGLQMLARDYLAAAKDVGKVSGELTAAKIKVEQLEAANKALNDNMVLMQRQVDMLMQKAGMAQPAGRPQENTLAEDAIRL